MVHCVLLTLTLIAYLLTAIWGHGRLLVAFAVADLVHLLLYLFQLSSSLQTYADDISAGLVLAQVCLVILSKLAIQLVGLYLYTQRRHQKLRSHKDIERFVRSRVELDLEDERLSKMMENVIPKHLVSKMREDILSAHDVQRGVFQKSYLESYERVSILFADIVNFTTISSDCSPQLLVETLNELFGRFDKAAQKNGCLRIKILGDCYYCVCGLPQNPKEPVPHAKSCVEMGLDMIDILATLAPNSKEVKLDMRVGIHTGRVLCGILGKKRWQFDVHSHDVKLANHLEQTGTRGRVHITDETLRELKGAYEVEPAGGEQRDTYIAQRGATTYFVVTPPERRRPITPELAVVAPQEATIKQVPVGDSLISPAAAAAAAAASTIATTVSLVPPRKRFRQTTQRIINALHFIKTCDAPFANMDAGTQLASVNIDKMICDTKAERKQITAVHKWGLQFEDGRLGRLYHEHYLAKTCRERLMMGSRQLLVFLFAAAALLLQAYAIIFQPLFHHNSNYDNPNDHNHQTAPYNTNHGITTAAEHRLQDEHDSRDHLPYTQPTTTTSTSSDLMNTTTTTTTTTDLQQRQQPNQSLHDYQMISLFAQFLTVILVASLVYLYRAEFEARRDFIWHQQAIEDKERMDRIRESNRLIFYNILPPHVAEYFLKNHRLGHADLYFQWYETIGVAFVTVANFGEFYMEDTSESGLRCLQVLNELLYDFDTLLEKFPCIDKIKTIGSTYMAVIGLSPAHKLPSSDSEARSRSELAKQLWSLLEFVISMRKCLQAFNKESYNSFRLRAGINMGAATAGVIGATKPQYDIWGNTVNVASRMESTCELDNIQVTEDFYKILHFDHPDGNGDDKKRDDIKFECRGEINIKGKGKMTTYYVVPE